MNVNVAYQEFTSGNLVAAKNILTKILEVNSHDPSALHLLAIVEKQSGEFDNALVLFDRAIRIAPYEAEIYSNKANLLAAMQDRNAIGIYGEAIRLQPSNLGYRLNRAITHLRFGDSSSAISDVEYLAPHMKQDAKFWTVAGQAYVAAKQRGRAKQAYNNALRLEPKRMTALAGIGEVLLKEGDRDASGYLRQALEVNPAAKEVAISYSESLEAEGKSEAAIDFLTGYLKQDVSWVEGQKALARMRWEAGDRDFATTLQKSVAAQSNNINLRMALIEILSNSEMFEEALTCARELRKSYDEYPDSALVEAKLARLCGRVDEAMALHELIADDIPGKALEAAQLWIRKGDFDKAQFLLTKAQSETEDVEFWAVQGVLWRITNSDMSHWLHPDALIQVLKLDLSANDLATIADTLRGFHKAREHPIGQSLRQGTQTRGALFERNERQVALLHAAIAKSVEDYWRALPAFDAAHPLLRHKNARRHFAGSWSVRLRGKGYHIPHIHPRGVLSSASYIVLPTNQNDSAGWLELGRPPPFFGLELAPVKVIEPIEGHLVLFPSTLYHGTIPFAEGERLTVAFDVAAKAD